MKVVNYIWIVMLFCITIPLVDAAGVQIGQAHNGVIIQTPSTQSCFICNGTGNTTYINNTYINNTYINQTFILNETIWANDSSNIFIRPGMSQNLNITNRSVLISGTPNSGGKILEINIEHEGDYGIYIGGNTADGMVINGAVNLTSVFNGYGYSSESFWLAQSSGRSYWGYLARPLIGFGLGTANNELVGFLSAQRTFNAILPFFGTLENFTSFESRPTWQSGTATNAVAFKATDILYTGGTIVNNYGLKVENLTAGTNNYAIWTEDNLVRLGGNLNVSKNVTATYYRGNGTFLTGVCHSASDPGCSSAMNYTNIAMLNASNQVFVGNATFGNVTAGFFIGNGTRLTGVCLTNGSNCNNTGSGSFNNANISYKNNSEVWNVDSKVVNLTGAGDISSNFTIQAYNPNVGSYDEIIVANIDGEYLRTNYYSFDGRFRGAIGTNPSGNGFMMQGSGKAVINVDDVDVLTYTSGDASNNVFTIMQQGLYVVGGPNAGLSLLDANVTPVVNNELFVGTNNRRFRGMFTNILNTRNTTTDRLFMNTTSSAASAGSVSLVSGSRVVNTTIVTANSLIFLTAQNGTAENTLAVTARNPGSNFTITSSSGLDTRLIAWHIIEPA